MNTHKSNDKKTHAIIFSIIPNQTTTDQILVQLNPLSARISPLPVQNPIFSPTFPSPILLLPYLFWLLNLRDIHPVIYYLEVQLTDEPEDVDKIKKKETTKHKLEKLK